MKTYLMFALIAFSLCPSIAEGRTFSYHPHDPNVGLASYYGKECAKRPMANGQKFDPNKATAASYAYPLGTKVVVTNLRNGKTISVTITDRGPNKRLNRLIDLSESAAVTLGYHHDGLTIVSVEVLTQNESKVLLQ